MLVLKRRKDEYLNIGNGIVVVVLSTGPKAAKLGIIAPGEVAVLRGEAKKKEPRNGR